jgi:CheY-like chemotaxis protein
VTKVLVVDDDPDFCEIVSMVLRKEGYEIESASSGDAALRQMRASPPDIVLLDVMMSTVLDGVNVSFAMAEDAVLKDVPIVMISSIPESSHADEFPTDEYVPISAWITKPVQPQQLVNIVKRLAG